MQTAKAPLFRDPVFDGPTDPTLIYNRAERSWWMVYTARRANVPCHGVSWVHGTDLGVASCADGGRTWLYRGTLQLDPIEPGRNTYWAPEILYHEGAYHMYVSYITGVPAEWVGDRRILHYKSADLWHWKYVGTLDLNTNRAIDACVYPLPGGGFRLWYKDENDQSRTHAADSADLYRWTPIGAQTADSQEGPNVFRLGGRYWLIADMWSGMAVYESDDLNRWTRHEETLLSGAGARLEDDNRGHHADVVEAGDHAYIFYFVHPGQKRYHYDDADHIGSVGQRRSSVQAAMLTCENGRLIVTRDQPFPFELPTP